MALDASKNNRTKEDFAGRLLVDYSEIYNTNKIEDIRKLLALECCIIDYFNTLKDTEKEKVMQDNHILLKLSDRELVEERKNRSDTLNSFK